MSVMQYIGIKGTRSRGAFRPSRGLPTIFDSLAIDEDKIMRRGDAFVSREAGPIAGVVNMPVEGFNVGDRIVFRGTDPTNAEHWAWFGPIGDMPANPHDGTKRALAYVLSEDDNNE